VKSVCLIDTTVFCNVLDVPGRNERRDEVIAEAKRLVEGGSTTLLLPLCVVVETGNHVARVADGNLRRSAAQRFVEAVRDALDGKAPWTPTPMPDARELVRWLDDFPDSASRGLGFAVLSVVKEWERQKALTPRGRVFIWSSDAHLSAYDWAGPPGSRDWRKPKRPVTRGGARRRT
jgi:hypothetical protein